MCPACLDGLVFLPANLSRLVIDPYREACRIGWRLSERLALDIPFFVAGFDTGSEELKVAFDGGVAAAGAGYLGRPTRDRAPRGGSSASRGATPRVTTRPGWCIGWASWHPMPTARARTGQLLGLLLGSGRGLEDAIVYALERDFDLLVLDGTGALGGEWP